MRILKLTPSNDPTVQIWRRNLAFLWLAEAAAALGMGLAWPFVPLYVQELGVTDPGRAAFWAGMASGMLGVCMMLMGPLWGVLGDRWGRKLSLMRALFASALALVLTGVAINVYQLLAFRAMFGLLGGVWIALMALGASSSPKDKVTFTIGVLQSAEFTGSSLGPFLGGTIAGSLGFNACFFIGGSMCAIGGIIVMVFVREKFSKPEQQESLGFSLLFRNISTVVRAKGLLAVLLVVLLGHAMYSMVQPVLPVFVQGLSTNAGAASSTGITFSIVGLSAVVSSLTISTLSNRFGRTRMLVAGLAVAGCIFLSFLVIENLLAVYAVMAVFGLCNGVIVTLTLALIGEKARSANQAAAYGVAQSASAFSWGVAPAIGGSIAAASGLRQVFAVDAVLIFITAGLVVYFLMVRHAKQAVQEVFPAGKL